MAAGGGDKEFKAIQSTSVAGNNCYIKICVIYSELVGLPKPCMSQPTQQPPLRAPHPPPAPVKLEKGAKVQG
jgi:hypothetical protein